MSDTSSADTHAENHPLLCWKWGRGGHATVVAVEGVFITVHSSVAYPPGAPLMAQSNSGQQFELKVRSCRRREDRSDEYTIDGKLFNAARETRERLQAAASHRPT